MCYFVISTSISSSYIHESRIMEFKLENSTSLIILSATGQGGRLSTYNQVNLFFPFVTGSLGPNLVIQDINEF